MLLKSRFQELYTPPLWKLNPMWIIFNGDFVSCILGGKSFVDIVDIELGRTVFTKLFANL